MNRIGKPQAQPNESEKLTSAVPTRAFIVGCPRSGTTLLQALLGTHPEMQSLPESRMFVEEHGIRGQMMASRVSRRHLWRLAEAIDAEDTLVALRPPRRSLSPRPYRRTAVNLLDVVASQRGFRCWLEKTPHHVYYLGTLRRYSPDARILHIVRDGRAVVASLYEVTRRHSEHWRGPWALERCIRSWNLAVEATSAAISSGQGILVNYEELVADPYAQVVRAGRYLGLTYSREMVASYQKVAPAIVVPKELWKAGLTEPIRDLGLEKFHAVLTDEQQRYVEVNLRERPLHAQGATATTASAPPTEAG